MVPALSEWWQSLGTSTQHLGYLTVVICGGLLLAVLSASLLRMSGNQRRRLLGQEVALRSWSWLWMAALLLAAAFAGERAMLILFALLSFQALREYLSLVPTMRADHRSLFWLFFIILPLHYLIIDASWYGLFAIFIPVWAFAFLAIRSALGGDPQRYRERCSSIHWGLMLCVYALSHLPALAMLDLPDFSGRQIELMLWVILVAQASDILQFVWGKSLGRHPIVPRHSPNKTWEGFLGGAASASVVGAALHGLTPFTPVEALTMAAVICATGFIGGVVMSAIKRDVGVKDFGQSLPGHGGVLDRIDSLIFTALVVFHLLRYYWGA